MTRFTDAWNRFWALPWWWRASPAVIAAAVVGGVVLATGDGDGPTPTPTDQTPTPTAIAPEGFSIYFLDVGQGDAILIEADTGETLLVDGGPNKETIRNRLNLLGVNDLDAILLTHADTDHYRGLVAVLEDFDIERIFWSGGSDGTDFEKFVTPAEDEGADISEVRRGDIVELGTLAIQVLHPATLTANKNADSLVLLVQCGTVEVLLAGDADKSSEQLMKAAGVLVDIDVLKVGHHGSDTATSPDFLGVVQPEYAVISAGLNSQYGHPHQVTLDALNAANAEVLLTDTTEDADGITLTTDCSQLTLEPTHPPAPEPTQEPEPTPTPTPPPGPTPTPPPPEPTPTPPPPEPTPTPSPQACHPSYPDFCIPPPPPDLNCSDIPQKNFTVLQPDPHGFDGNKDGVGCES